MTTPFVTAVLTPAELATAYANAHRTHELARAHYRARHAQAQLDALAADPKVSEWKVTAAWEACDEFSALKRVLADTEHARMLARAAYLDACPHAAEAR